MRRTTYLIYAFAAGCSTPPGPPPAPMVALEVMAPFDRTWNAVIDIFALQQIPIATLEKASGLIVANPLYVSRQNGIGWADCGSRMGEAIPATRATFNVVVRAVGTASSVRVTASWATIGAESYCVTTGEWEKNFQNSVKRSAEAKP